MGQNRICPRSKSLHNLLSAVGSQKLQVVSEPFSTSCKNILVCKLDKLGHCMSSFAHATYWTLHKYHHDGRVQPTDTDIPCDAGRNYNAANF